MKFIDSIEIFVRSGDGGPGMVSFRSAHNKPKLGADGGDGGFGGDVILVGAGQLNTLSSLRYRAHYNADHGQKGGSNNKTGADGENRVIKVPLGTEVYRTDDGRKIAEILSNGEEVMIAKGGKRGLGNYRYLSSTHQAPEESTTGGKGEEFHLRLDLKLIADIGFAGFPNAGKSTLLSLISAAKPKIANYPFTTLEPYLGVVDIDEKSFVAADIPGLIEGASEGKGLGHAFLKHLERTAVTAYVIEAVSVEGREILPTFEALRKELQAYSAKLATKPGVVVITKKDLVQTEEEQKAVWDAQKKLEDLGFESVVVSAVQRENIPELKRFLLDAINRHAVRAEESVQEIVPEEIRDEDEPKLTMNFLDEYTIN